MVLIIGGAYQGKLTYAVKHFGLSRDEIFDLENLADIPVSEAEIPTGCRCFFHLESLTKKAAEENISPEELISLLQKRFSDAIIISREIGSGIVPADAFGRRYRELHGAVLSALAMRSQSVIRIFCGLAEKLK